MENQIDNLMQISANFWNFKNILVLELCHHYGLNKREATKYFSNMIDRAYNESNIWRNGILSITDHIYEEDIIFYWNKFGYKNTVNLDWIKNLKYDQVKNISFGDFKLSNLQIQKLKGYEKYIPLLLLAYKTFPNDGYQLSVPPIIIKEMRIDHELFSSPLNTTVSSFCSAWEEIDCFFGSKGSFFSYQLENNKIYLANPPFIENFMDKAMKRIIEQMKNVQNVTIFVTLPVWDSEGQRKIPGMKDYGMNFKAIEYLDQSGLVKEKIILLKDKYPFFCHTKEKYTFSGHNYLYILSNGEKNYDLEKILSLWNNLK